MDEYISREAVLNLIEHNDKVCHYKDERYENVVYSTTQTICKVVAEMPAADVQPVNQWISVKDRPPNQYEEVLVVSKLENIVYFAWYDADISMFMGHSHMWTTREVTHWMSLPKPPKDGDSE